MFILHMAALPLIIVCSGTSMTHMESFDPDSTPEAPKIEAALQEAARLDREDDSGVPYLYVMCATMRALREGVRDFNEDENRYPWWLLMDKYVRDYDLRAICDWGTWDTHTDAATFYTARFVFASE